MASNTFSFITPNFLRLNSPNGVNNYTFANGLPMSPIANYPTITNLADLIKQVGQPNIKINYYISGSGQVPAHQCDCTHAQIASLNIPNYNSVGIQVFSDQGQNGKAWNLNPTGWYLVAQNINGVPSSLNMTASKNGPGCGCAGNDDLRTWENVYVSLKADVTITGSITPPENQPDTKPTTTPQTSPIPETNPPTQAYASKTSYLKYIAWIILGIVVLALIIYFIYLFVHQDNAKKLAMASLPHGSPFTPGPSSRI
jgi:hypothetical protein